MRHWMNRLAPLCLLAFSTVTMAGADTVISLGAQTIVLAGVQMASLTASDFLFV